MNRNQRHNSNADNNNNHGYNNQNNQPAFYFHPSQYQPQPHPPPQVQPPPQQHFYSSLPSSSSSSSNLHQSPSSSNNHAIPLNGNSQASSGSILGNSSQPTPTPTTAEERDEAIASLTKRRDALKFTITNLQSEKELARISGRSFQSEHTLSHLRDTLSTLSDQLIEVMTMQFQTSGTKRKGGSSTRGPRALKPGWTPGATFGAHQASEAWNRAIPNRHVGLTSGLQYKPHQLLFPPRRTNAKKEKGEGEEEEDEEDTIENELGIGGGSSNSKTLAELSKALCGRCRVGHGSHKTSGIGRFNNSEEDFRVQEGSFGLNPNTYSGSSEELSQSTPCGCVISDVLLQFFIFKSVRLTHDKNSKLYNQACPWFNPEQLQYLKTFLWKFCGVNLDSLYQTNQRDRFLSIRNELDRRLSNENELNNWWEYIGKVDELTIEQVEYCLKMEEEEKVKKRKLAEENKKNNENGNAPPPPPPPTTNVAANVSSANSTPQRGPGRPRKDGQPPRQNPAKSRKGKEVQR